MPATFQALAVVAVALLPGALYTWAFERIAGRWGISLADRVYRFVGISAFFHALIAPASYRIWIDQIQPGALQAGEHLPLWLWPVALAYVALPAAIGTGLAAAFKAERRWAKRVVGPVAAPTAWDALFSGEPGGYVLMKLKGGAWVGGEYEEGSFVGGYPAPADIYLVDELVVDQDDEDFFRDAEGDVVSTGFGLLVRWNEVEYLEITD